MRKLLISFCVLSLVLGCTKPGSATRDDTSERMASDADCKNAPPLDPAALHPSLWLRADRGVRLRKPGNAVLSWTDMEENRVEFSAARGKEPTLSRTANGRPAILFTGGDQTLKSDGILGGRLFAPKENSLVLVMRQNGQHPVNDTFGWGDCNKNRLNTHLSAGGHLIVQSGDPAMGQIDTTAPNGWLDRLHVVSIVRDGDSLRISVDGLLQDSITSLHTQVNAGIDAPFEIGGICSNGFGGKISEILLFRTALDTRKECGLAKSLATKYGIPWRQ